METISNHDWETAISKHLNGGKSSDTTKSIIAFLYTKEDRGAIEARTNREMAYPSLTFHRDIAACLDLFEKAPFIKEEFHRMADASSHWAGVVKHWDIIVQCYLVEKQNPSFSHEYPVTREIIHGLCYNPLDSDNTSKLAGKSTQEFAEMVKELFHRENSNNIFKGYSSYIPLEFIYQQKEIV